jgi:predicted phosphodiesterase
MEWVTANPPPYNELTKRSKAPGLRVLWITPLRALAADTASAMQAPLTDLGIPWTLETRTSDTTTTIRNRQCNRLPTALITTPESLSLLLTRDDAAEQFRDLQRLTQALNNTQATRLIILGDMIHTAKGRDEQTLLAFSAWRKQHPEIELLLVRGNHDKQSGDPPSEWGVRCVDAPVFNPPFTLSHIPFESDSDYVLAGHLHPAVQLVGKGRQTLKLPCFRFGATWASYPHLVASLTTPLSNLHRVTESMV